MSRLLLAAIHGAIAAVALGWRCGPMISIALAPVGASLLTLLVAATGKGKRGTNPARHDIGAFTAVDRT